MKDLASLHRRMGENLSGPLRGEVTDAYEPFGLENVDHTSHVLVAREEERGCLRSWQLVRRQVATVRVEKRQRAIIRDKVVVEGTLKGIPIPVEALQALKAAAKP